MSIRDWTYKFTTEDGEFSMTYADYLKNEELIRKIHDTERRKIVLCGHIVSFPKCLLNENKKLGAAFIELEREYRQNPLKYFMPSGNTIREFINDSEFTISGLYSGNRGGKSTSSFIKAAVRFIPCDKDWPIFTTGGIKYHDFNGPKVVGIASYEFTNHKTTLWPQVIKKWLPASELGAYAYGGTKTINWKDNPKIELKCGTTIYFYAYSQDQGVYESQAVDIWLWDEQGVESKFDGANERTRTVDGIHIFGLTPHKVQGRPDTGMGSWIEELRLGKTTKGHKVKFWMFSLLDDVPDWIYSEEQKKAAYKQHITEPTERNDVKALRAGRSRLFGEPESSEGLVYDEWAPEYHVIDPFDIPKTWTRYRSIDHGTRNPEACLWGAVSPAGDLFLYKEYIQIGKTISENCRAIIELSGNRAIPFGSSRDSKSGLMYEIVDELQCKEKYYKTMLDARSAATPEAALGMDIAQAYRVFGLKITPASGKDDGRAIPIVKEWLRINFERDHYITKKKGAPRVYVFSTLNNFIGEISSYVNQEYIRVSDKNPVERPRQKDDHLMDCLKYMVQAPAIYIDGFGEDDDIFTKSPEINIDRFTGY